ncbi:hypothetical protein [Bacillus sp. FJAT-50079]|uniref:DUF6980 family protein n=1 Tax=Bacillus sp. FJAT-50079 TaxID=2833577 RepID=UPI001BC9AC67|nr:hypothetical protein [Bacillus sp. FJAT-50079]MBS4209499.1 hypothetical protein [Bacillus sp. FJAT-50079]
MKQHCCEYMNDHATFQCDLHDDPFKCPDQLILFDEKANDYSLMIHDGGSSVIGIKFCPWCGTNLSFRKDEK